MGAWIEARRGSSRNSAARHAKKKKRNVAYPRRKGTLSRRKNLRPLRQKNPKHVAAVQTAADSHTHNLRPGPTNSDKVYILSLRHIVRSPSRKSSPAATVKSPTKTPKHRAISTSSKSRFQSPHPKTRRCLHSPTFYRSTNRRDERPNNGGHPRQKSVMEKPARLTINATTSRSILRGLAAGACSGNGILSTSKTKSIKASRRRQPIQIPPTGFR